MLTLRAHLRELEMLRAELRAERDRRYTEVGIEREKALKIKEIADLAALELAREIQQYKDEKANDLRSQIERERGTYVTQADLTNAVARLEALIQPAADYAKSQAGRGQGINAAWTILATIVLIAIAALGLVLTR